jgi:hypothetical protein
MLSELSRARYNYEHIKEKWIQGSNSRECEEFYLLDVTSLNLYQAAWSHNQESIVHYSKIHISFSCRLDT